MDGDIQELGLLDLMDQKSLECHIIKVWFLVSRLRLWYKTSKHSRILENPTLSTPEQDRNLEHQKNETPESRLP